jgi:hypothetical protein
MSMAKQFSPSLRHHVVINISNEIPPVILPAPSATLIPVYP